MMHASTWTYIRNVCSEKMDLHFPLPATQVASMYMGGRNEGSGMEAVWWFP